MKLISFPSLDDWWTLTPSDQRAGSVQWQNQLQFVSCVKSVMKHMKHLKYFQSNHIHRHIACRPISVAVSRTSVHETWCHPQQQLLISPVILSDESTSSFNMFNYWAKVKTTNMEPGSKGGNVFKVKKEVSHRTGPAEPPPSLQLCGAFSHF